METPVMTRLLPKLLLLIVTAMVALPGHAGDELAGYWQHESDPVWICLLYTSDAADES